MIALHLAAPDHAIVEFGGVEPIEIAVTACKALLQPGDWNALLHLVFPIDILNGIGDLVFLTCIGGLFKPCKRFAASRQERVARNEQEHRVGPLVLRDRIPERYKRFVSIIIDQIERMSIVDHAFQRLFFPR